MAYYSIPDPETLIPCPYDKVHMVAAKRMQYHLMKCRKNFTGREYATCPFNARHEMPKPELRYHIANCPDKAMLEPILSYEQSKMSEEGKNFKGCTDLPKYDDNHTRNAENWDEEIPENPRIGVDPSYFARMEYKDFTGMSRSEKKTWKKQLNLPPEQRQYPVKVENKEEEEEKQLRKPHTMPSKFMQPQQIQQPSQVLSYSLAMAGIGRGGAGLTGQGTSGVGHAIGRGEPSLGRGVGRADMLPSSGHAVGRGDKLPGVGRAMGRAAAIQNYTHNNMMNGLTNGTQQIVTEVKTEDVNGQYDDVLPQEPKIADIPYIQPAGIGRGRGAPPSTFTVGMGRGMLRDFQTNENPSFVVPKVSPTESSNNTTEQEQEGEINADAKNKERKKIEKKLKQIEFLEEKQREGYKFNSDEILKVQAKDKLLEALEKLQL